VPLMELAVVVVISDLSIILLNSSLRINSLVIYQIAKLGVVPITCLAEAMLYGRVFTRPVIAAIAFTLLGVVLVSFGSERNAGSDGSDDVDQPIVGVFVALGSMFAAAAQQLSIRHLQLKHSVSSADLLSVVAPAQGISLLLVSAPVDYALTGAFISSFDFTTASTMCLASSCFSAVAVNVSQFMVLGKFSAVTYQVRLAEARQSRWTSFGRGTVISLNSTSYFDTFTTTTTRPTLAPIRGMVLVQLLGHAKTVLVLVAGWLFFNQSLTTQQMLGIAMAILVTKKVTCILHLRSLPLPTWILVSLTKNSIALSTNVGTNVGTNRWYKTAY
jgi:hypothetical protein